MYSDPNQPAQDLRKGVARNKGEELIYRLQTNDFADRP
jgi:hypothetical protein